MIGEEGKGFRYILDGMNAERCLVSAESIGNARFLLNKAVKYANERIVFDRPIGKNQGIQFPIADAYIKLQTADLMVRKATAMFEAGCVCGAEANCAKYLSSEALWAAPKHVLPLTVDLHLLENMMLRKMAGRTAITKCTNFSKYDYEFYWTTRSWTSSVVLNLCKHTRIFG